MMVYVLYNEWGFIEETTIELVGVTSSKDVAEEFKQLSKYGYYWEYRLDDFLANSDFGWSKGKKNKQCADRYNRAIQQIGVDDGG